MQSVSQWHVRKDGVEEEAPKLTMVPKKMMKQRKLLKRNRKGKGKGEKKNEDDENEKEKEKEKDKSRSATASILQAMLGRDILKRDVPRGDSLRRDSREGSFPNGEISRTILR